jgi:putative flippase GtrA
MMAISRERLLEVWRYYQAGLVNTAFGYGAYALLVWLGLNMFAAQLISHLMGMAFNYMTFSRHVFRDAPPDTLRYIVSYGGNYLLGLTSLAALSHVVHSPYLAGLCSIVVVSVINYFLLRHFVFRSPAA